jgi:hypothetical protein
MPSSKDSMHHWPGICEAATRHRCEACAAVACQRHNSHIGRTQATYDRNGVVACCKCANKPSAVACRFAALLHEHGNMTTAGDAEQAASEGGGEELRGSPWLFLEPKRNTYENAALSELWGMVETFGLSGAVAVWVMDSDHYDVLMDATRGAARTIWGYMDQEFEDQISTVPFPAPVPPVVRVCALDPYATCCRWTPTPTAAAAAAAAAACGLRVPTEACAAAVLHGPTPAAPANSGPFKQLGACIGALRMRPMHARGDQECKLAGRDAVAHVRHREERAGAAPHARPARRLAHCAVDTGL